MLASCCVAKKIFLSQASASSSARTLDSRPTTNGVIMYGKMTTSRMGIMGIFLLSNFSLGFDTQSPVSGFLGYLRSDATFFGGARTDLTRCFFNHGQRNVAFFHHFAGHFELFN